jgi:hypothetical protein
VSKFSKFRQSLVSWARYGGCRRWPFLVARDFEEALEHLATGTDDDRVAWMLATRNSERRQKALEAYEGVSGDR